MTNHPSDEMLNDAEGRELVQSIHDRQEQRRELFQLILGRTTTKAVERILAAGYRKLRTITTVEELDALPDMTVVRSKAGTIANIVGDRAYVFGFEGSAPRVSLALPATILHEGES